VAYRDAKRPASCDIISLKEGSVKYSKGLVLILLIAIIFLAGVGATTAGYFGYKFYQKKSEEKREQTKEKLEALPKTEKEKEKTPEKEDETADWKTYVNKQYNYSIKYPPDWEVQMEAYLQEDAPAITSGYQTEVTGDLIIGINHPEVMPASGKEAFEEEKKVPYAFKRILSEGEVIIGGAKGYRVIYIARRDTDKEAAVQKIYLIHNNVYYTFLYEEQKNVAPWTWTTDYTKWKYAPTLDTMLSTFQFIK
jgi:hypothetical protein